MSHTESARTHGMWHADLISKNGHILRTTWLWTRDTTNDTKFSGNVLECVTYPSTNREDSPVSDHDNENDGFSAIRLCAGDSDRHDSTTTQLATTSSHQQALSYLWTSTRQRGVRGGVRIKYLLPPESGFVVRSDLMEFSLHKSTHFASAQGFLQPAQKVTAPFHSDGDARKLSTKTVLLHLLCQAVGAATVADTDDTEASDAQFRACLSWPWSTPKHIAPKRVALVGESRKQRMSQEFYTAARAMAISVVVLDSPGHWAEAAESVEHFVPFVHDGCSPDEITAGVVDTVRRLPYRVDGLIAVLDTLLSSVAHAAEVLGLPTLSSEAYLRGTDKYETRKFSPAAVCIKLDNLEDLETQLSILDRPLEYPLIVKPTRANGAEGVTRVERESELRTAVQLSFSKQAEMHVKHGVVFDHCPVVIETYCDGPEVDVNMLLWNGEILHAEVSDNFPPSGEEDSSKGFVCVGSLTPSVLPPTEIEMLKRDIHAICCQIGLHSGTIHAEARVQNSSYALSVGGICPELRSSPNSGSPSTFLLEINPRFAGYPDAILTSYTYGTDYFAAHLLHAIGDEARFRSIAHSLHHSLAKLSHHAWHPIAIIPATRGVFQSDADFEAVGLAEAYAAHRYFYTFGDEVPAEEERSPFGAGYVFFKSEKGPERAVEAVRKARQDLRVELKV